MLAKCELDYIKDIKRSKIVLDPPSVLKWEKQVLAFRETYTSI